MHIYGLASHVFWPSGIYSFTRLLNKPPSCQKARTAHEGRRLICQSRPLGSANLTIFHRSNTDMVTGSSEMAKSLYCVDCCICETFTCRSCDRSLPYLVMCDGRSNRGRQPRKPEISSQLRLNRSLYELLQSKMSTLIDSRNFRIAHWNLHFDTMD